ncbi:unnamed protein product [Timema podura]|uniref:Uncharacterized protein n=1 Tax=Timema podura TaxID=61482 RepID=A0ABN7NGK5_TIMPD|nr:unnamed protein product [Timema podura]
MKMKTTTTLSHYLNITRFLVIICVLCLSQRSLCDDSLGEVEDTGEEVIEIKEDRGWWSFLECLGTEEVGKCLSTEALKALEKMTGPGRKGVSQVSAEADEDLTSSLSGSSFVQELGDLVSYGVSRLIPLIGDVESEEEEEDDDGETAASEEEGENDDAEEVEGENGVQDADGKTGNEGRNIVEGRGKKKKKRKLQLALLKLFMLGMFIKSKLTTLLLAFSALVQTKFLLFTVINLLVNLFRLYLDWHKTKEQPQKVIYYEHAQHQHHYDQEHHHHEDKGWLGSLWSRSIEEPTEQGDTPFSPHNLAYQAQKPAPVYSSAPVYKPDQPYFLH